MKGAEAEAGTGFRGARYKAAAGARCRSPCLCRRECALPSLLLLLPPPPLPPAAAGTSRHRRSLPRRTEQVPGAGGDPGAGKGEAGGGEGRLKEWGCGGREGRGVWKGGVGGLVGERGEREGEKRLGRVRVREMQDCKGGEGGAGRWDGWDMEP